jgi:5'-deoxynucleotidase YfbR-like HD superfamily hydrolase
MFTHEDVYTKAHFAGRVKRYHTWPVLHDQTVGEHTWQVMRIYWQIFGPMPAEVSSFILWHDAGELLAGDAPGMLKILVPEIKPILDRVECKAVDAMGGACVPVSDQMRVRVKVCDLIEVYEQCSIELLQGNRLVEGGITWARDQLEVMTATTTYTDDAFQVRNYLRRHKAWCNR